MHKSMIFFIQCECDWINVYKAFGKYDFVKRINVLGMINPTDLLVFGDRLYIPDDMTLRMHCSRCINSDSDHCVWEIDLPYSLDPERMTGKHPEKRLTSLRKWRPWSLSRTSDGKQIIITTKTKKAYFWNPNVNQMTLEVVTLPRIVHCAQHIIELSCPSYLLCHYPHAKSCLRKVCRLVREDDRMTFEQNPSVMDHLDNPWHLAQLPGGKILVVDHDNNRLLVMAEDLSSYKELLSTTNGGKKRPCRIAYDKPSNLLLVAFHHYVGLYSLDIEALP